MTGKIKNRLQESDFAMALKEIGTYIDVSVGDLMEIHQRAEKHARMRVKEDRVVEHFMTQPVKHIRPECTLSDAAHILVEYKISGLPVINDSHKLVGIVTEADFLKALGVPSHQPSHSLWQTLENMFHQTIEIIEPGGSVADLMRKDVVTVAPHQTLKHVLETMKQHQIKRLIVCDEKQNVVGMITRSDLVRIFFDHFTKVEVA